MAWWSRCAQIIVLASAAMVATEVPAAEQVHHGLQAAIYQWYGKLDTIMNASHHLLSIGQPRHVGQGDQAHVEVNVQLESQERRLGQSHYPGHYEEQVLHISGTLERVLHSQSVLYSLDDFDSKYRPSRANNLIKALVFSWTHGLDTYDESALQRHLLVNSTFVAAELRVQKLIDYVPYLRSLNYLKNHRNLNKLNIETLNIEQDTYRVTYEYQWWAVNQQGESELAQMAVEMQVQIIAGRAMISLYKETYLAPITDAGAEVRC